MPEKNIPIQTLRRLPVYLHYLNTICGQQKNISATAISDAFGLNDVQVRKDLASVSGEGRPKTGYEVTSLIKQMEYSLGYGKDTKAVLVGAGNLGKALLAYEGFDDYGLDIIAAFDNEPSLSGKKIHEKPIYPTADLEYICTEKNIRLGIITTPVNAAQDICNRLVMYGIKAVWNFAPTILKAPEGVIVENENLASSLAILSRHLKQDEGSWEEE